MVRDEGPGDAAFRFGLFQRSRGAEWEAMAATPAFAPLMRQQFAAQNAAYAGSRLLIIETEAGAPIGRLALAGGDCLRIVDIALSPDMRGRGFGSALIGALQREARARGLPLRLSVARTNARAGALYRRLGFDSCGGDAVYAEMVWRA
jgi:ribosomal protein S18 acetylase RimI-like enzyme